MRKSITLEVLNVEEAAKLLKLKPDAIFKAIESGELKARSKEEIPGPALSEWWKSKGGDAVLLEDFLERIPWLPALYVEATDALESKSNARAWFFEKNVALGMKTPIEFAETEEGSSEVLQLIYRIRYGLLS
ncbi:MAG: MbcA/ParS/Xre antitoxin family protein [Pseudomonadota bacterium]|nr:MbcA/ParS/Xre antitoxin family protein [Pseudomonadota bacterium]